jgi:hypothetical protein
MWSDLYNELTKRKHWNIHDNGVPEDEDDDNSDDSDDDDVADDDYADADYRG